MQEVPNATCSLFQSGSRLLEASPGQGCHFQRGQAMPPLFFSVGALGGRLATSSSTLGTSKTVHLWGIVQKTHLGVLLSPLLVQLFLASTLPGTLAWVAVQLAEAGLQHLTLRGAAGDSENYVVLTLLSAGVGPGEGLLSCPSDRRRRMAEGKLGSKWCFLLTECGV